MATVESDIIAAGAQIIWVLEESVDVDPGTAELCRDYIEFRGGSAGLCVGDAQTEPTAGAFDRSALANTRGFDMIVTRRDMVIRYSSTHGTGGRDENRSGDELLAEVRRVISEL